MAFVDYIELMSATGGNAENDPFAEPLNREVLDDYNFSRIVSSCRGILNLVAKPFLKLGNIPLKLSAEPLIGDFGCNVRPPPPHDYDEWYRFLRAYLGALTDAFVVDEVSSWRFGVFTEYENPDCYTLDGNILPEKLRERYETELRDKYKTLAELTPQVQVTEFGEVLNLSVDADANSAVFIEILPR